jgi:CPA1 family monovalent cation:H+ antiporter
LIWENASISLIVLAAFWLSRALITYALLPQIGHLQRQAKTTRVAFRHLVFVGGMRGAVTMALAIGLPCSGIKLSCLLQSVWSFSLPCFREY